MSSNAVEFKNVTKVYSKYVGLQKVKNFLDIVKNGQIGKKLIKEADFYALKNITFSIKQGECLGIIGPNGAGKSTILKMINNIVYPSSGTIFVNGTVGGLVELGAGFHHELSGRDNIFINAAIFGFSKSQTLDIYDQILDISELHHYIDVPIKKYSSGMLVRLGFAVAMATNPDVVLLDEVLAVGDAKFQKKSLELMTEYIKNKTVVFVSHSMVHIKSVCNRVMVIDHGNIVFDGDTDEAIEYYNEINLIEKKSKSEKKVIAKNVRRGFAEVTKVEVKSVKLFNYDEKEVSSILKGERVIILLTYSILKIIGNLFIRIIIKKTFMKKFSEIIDEFYLKIPKKELTEKKNELRVSFNTKNLKPGVYTIEILPEFENQSKKTAVSLYSHPLIIESESEDEQGGLIDLDFEVETITTNL